MYVTIFQLSNHKSRDQRDYTEKGGPCWLLKLRPMGNQVVHRKGVLPWLVRWASRTGSRDCCLALAVLVGPEQNIFLVTSQCFTSFLPIAQQAGLAVVPGRLSLNMCLGLRHCGYEQPPIPMTGWGHLSILMHDPWVWRAYIPLGRRGSLEALRAQYIPGSLNVFSNNHCHCWIMTLTLYKHIWVCSCNAFMSIYWKSRMNKFLQKPHIYCDVPFV
jgi:hypothetical protein